LIRKHQNKIRGVKGAKPRFKTNGKPASKEEIDKLSKEYLQIRNEHQRTKTLSAQMELGRVKIESSAKIHQRYEGIVTRFLSFLGLKADLSVAHLASSDIVR
jgi:hypothetical protein